MKRHEDVPKSQSRRDSLAGCALEDAEKGIRRCLRAIGPVSEGERYGAEWRALENWCAGEGLIAEKNLKPEREGGREHDLCQLSGRGIWLKFTKPWSSGYAVDLSGENPALLPARPLQYLLRLRLQNRYFGDSIRFIGISSDRKARRVITSQPDIIGRLPTWEEINAWFLDHGYRKLSVRNLGGYDSTAYAGHGIGVFDVRPVNAVISEEGIFLPIDLMVRRMTVNQVRKIIAE